MFEEIYQELVKNACSEFKKMAEYDKFNPLRGRYADIGQAIVYSLAIMARNFVIDNIISKEAYDEINAMCWGVK